MDRHNCQEHGITEFCRNTWLEILIQLEHRRRSRGSSKTNIPFQSCLITSNRNRKSENYSLFFADSIER